LRSTIEPESSPVVPALSETSATSPPDVEAISVSFSALGVVFLIEEILIF
jgi:hypothetical protein